MKKALPRDDDSNEADCTAVENSHEFILASLQSYKETLADNDESKIAGIKTQIKSVDFKNFRKSTVLDNFELAKAA